MRKIDDSVVAIVGDVLAKSLEKNAETWFAMQFAATAAAMGGWGPGDGWEPGPLLAGSDSVEKCNEIAFDLVSRLARLANEGMEPYRLLDAIEAVLEIRGRVVPEQRRADQQAEP